MKYINLNTIKKKILACNGILLVILLLVLVFALVQLNLNQRLLAEEEKAIEALNKITEIEENFLEFQYANIEFVLLLEDEIKQHRDSGYKKLKDDFINSTVPEIKAKASNLDRYYATTKKAATFFINDDRMSGSLLLNTSKKISAEILTALKSEYFKQKKNLGDIVVSVHVSNMRVTYSIYALLVVMLVVGVGISLFLANMISRELVNLKSTVEKIEASGDLTQRADVQSNDEIGSLATAFNKLVEKLANIVFEVKENSSQLAISAEQLSEVTNHANQGIQRQADEISKVATAMSEMSATVSEVACNAQNASDSANEGNNEATKGSQVVNQTIVAISELANDVQHSADVIEKLKTDSENIETVLDVIKNIAEQTNLLALNAAIEAARAGEQGRGFAVVADEVRTLAQRTKESTLEIETLVATLQNGAQSAFDVINKSRTKADDTVVQAEQAGVSLAAITQVVGNILNTNIQIASAAEEQAATTEEVNRNINNIQSVAEQSADGAKMTAQASLELSDLGKQLSGLVDQFKV